MGFFDFLKKKEQSQQEAPEVDKLDSSLNKTRTGFFGKLGKALMGKGKVSALELDDIEEALIAADVGLATTVKIIDRLEARVARDKYLDTDELHLILYEEIQHLLSENRQARKLEFATAPGRPYVIMVVGVNGVGKTTTIGKIATQYAKMGKKVVLGAADTFRAAAVDQLAIWAQRSGAEFVSRGMHADPAAVAFDAVEAATARSADVVIVDTAGRLHNKVNLMNELSKIKRVIEKVVPSGPDEVVLVLDASTGQNALEQAKQFMLATDINTLALTKLDGTAKGGVVLAIVDQFKVPIKYIGVGEKQDDLRIFDQEAFVKSLFT
ncbi:MAG: signal recognition particle-docking protein FtsY [Bacteroidetes bacterium]|jgi:fused signal recognition particle receptor|nr:signal recognition particle-docking protein FtsY [Bacteroidota bacterium]